MLEAVVGKAQSPMVFKRRGVMPSNHMVFLDHIWPKKQFTSSSYVVHCLTVKLNLIDFEGFFTSKCRRGRTTTQRRQRGNPNIRLCPPHPHWYLRLLLPSCFHRLVGRQLDVKNIWHRTDSKGSWRKGVRLVHTGEAGQRYEVKHENEKFLKEQIKEDRIILNRFVYI